MKKKKFKKIFTGLIILLTITLICPLYLNAKTFPCSNSTDLEATDSNNSFRTICFLDLSVNSFFPANSVFKSIYKNSIIVPEINVGCFITQKLYIFGGFEFYKIQGITPVWNIDLKMTESIITAGGGYFYKFSKKFGVKGELGLVVMNYQEEVLESAMKEKSNCLGLRLRTSMHYAITNFVGLSLKIGYTFIGNKVNESVFDFGGFTAGIGLTLSLNKKKKTIKKSELAEKLRVYRKIKQAEETKQSADIEKPSSIKVKAEDKTITVPEKTENKNLKKNLVPIDNKKIVIVGKPKTKLNYIVFKNSKKYGINWKIVNDGVKIIRINLNGNFGSNGIKRGDILSKINGIKITNGDELDSERDKMYSGKIAFADLTIIRGKKTLVFRLTKGKRD